MFARILIANRGEIAVRIIRACKEMGIKALAVYSEADSSSLHRYLADESICIGPGIASESYLDPERIISAALALKADAVHPGYGFLSENPVLAEKCRENSIAFIGPDADVMLRLSDKSRIKKIAEEGGLPVIPGSDVLKNAEEAVEIAEAIGYPVMLKAVSGGGGRGIRRIASSEELIALFPIAEKESLSTFGDGSLYLEKCIENAKHIEVQILADEKGNAIALGERDCSLQRHHQKVLEESPSPVLSESTRCEMLRKCEEAVIHMRYTGAGTLEFLLDGQGNYYFMEMNLRLQVEHGVTEILTGIDLVKWQIRIAAGIPISFTRSDVRLNGSAIECRINARSLGTVRKLHIPGGPFVRFDTYLDTGAEISPYYDSLIGKLIVYSKSREESIRKMRAYLCELVIEGIETNIEEELSILCRPDFIAGTYDTSTLESL